MTEISSIIFGPVPSRRLGSSLGINNIPPKSCNYNCVYCQLGRNQNYCHTRSNFYPISQISAELTEKITQIQKRKLRIDYITFVADGEPTLDLNLGEEIRKFKQLGYKIAVITNATFLSDFRVRDELSVADWVSVKVDAVSENIWRRINRPFGALNFKNILKGIIEFSKCYPGILCTETMFVNNINTTIDEIEKIVDFLTIIRPEKCYLSIPTRPPAESFVEPPTDTFLVSVYQKFDQRCLTVEYLIGYEGDDFYSTGNLTKDILNIMSVHPMKKCALIQMLQKNNASWNLVEKLIETNQIKEILYNNEQFFIRNLLLRRQ